MTSKDTREYNKVSSVLEVLCEFHFDFILFLFYFSACGMAAHCKIIYNTDKLNRKTGHQMRKIVYESAT